MVGLRRDIGITAISSFLVTVLGFYVFRIAAQQLGPEGFGSYAIARRVISTLMPVTMLGLAVSLTREVAFRQASNHSENVNDLINVIAISLMGAIVLFGVAGLFPEAFSRLFFGIGGFGGLIPPLATYLSALCVQGALFSYWRGQMKMVPANLLQIIVVGVAPVIAFVGADGDLQRVFWVTSGVAWVANLLSLSAIFWRNVNGFQKWKFSPWRLLKIGVPRVPGDLALAGLIAVPTFVVAKSASLIQAGGVSFGITIVVACGGLIAPISTVMLPYSVRQISNDLRDALRADSLKIVIAISSVGVLSYFLFLCISERFIRGFLGPEYLEISMAIKIVTFAAVPYSIFVGLRSIVDALNIKPFNAYNCYSAVITYFLTLAILLQMAEPLIASCSAFVASMTVLAGLTIRSITIQTR